MAGPQTLRGPKKFPFPFPALWTGLWTVFKLLMFLRVCALRKMALLF